MKPLRPDFASASVGLTLPGQRKNLEHLHDWLIDELAIAPQELVVALTNYQQGRFGRLPSHILVVTTERIAFTHDGGLRSVPLADLDTNRIGLKAGLVNGEVTLLTQSGEQLKFRRGMSIAMQEVASAVRQLGDRSGPAIPPIPRRDHGSKGGASEDGATANKKKKKKKKAASNTDGQSVPEEVARIQGYGDDILSFVEPVDGVAFLEIRGNQGDDHFAVWSLSPSLEQDDLLVNTTSPYGGVCVIGLQGPVAALQMSATGPWDVRFVAPSELPTLNDEVSGSGDSVIFLRDDFESVAAATILRVNAQCDGNITLWVHGDVSDLLVNDMDSYSGAVVVPSGAQYLVLTCDGPWSLSAG